MEVSSSGAVEISEETSVADLIPDQVDLVKDLQNSAVVAWWTPGHPGWYPMGTKETPARPPLKVDGSASPLSSCTVLAGRANSL